MSSHERRRNIIITERVEIKLKSRWEILQEDLLIWYEFLDQKRAKAKKWCASSFPGLLYNNFMMCVSVISLLSFIVQTYFDRRRDHATLKYFDALDWCLAILFSFDWSLNFILTDNKLTFMGR